MGMQTQKPQSKSQVALNLFAFLNGENVYALGGVKHEIDADEQTALQLLQQAVPHDALRAYRIGFRAEEQMVRLEDGSPALPGHIFQALRLAGKAFDLFEPVMRKLDAPADPLFCLTVVRDGVPFNDDGPIYEGGTPESDRRHRHTYFAAQNQDKLAEVNRAQFAQKGQGAVILMSAPKPTDFENRDVLYLSVEECNLPEPVTSDIQKMLAEYDPATEMVLVFGEADGDHIYRVVMPEEETVAPAPPAFRPVRKPRDPKTGRFIWELPCESSKAAAALTKAIKKHRNIRCLGTDPETHAVRVTFKGSDLEVAILTAHTYAMEAAQGLTGPSLPDPYPFLSALIHVGYIDDAYMLADYALPEQGTPALYFTDRTVVQMVLRADDGSPFFFAYSSMCPQGELGEYIESEVAPSRISALWYHTQFGEVPRYAKYVEKWMSGD